MGEGLDTGDIISQRSIPIEDDDTGGSLFDKLSELGAELTVDTIKDIAAGGISPVPQDETQASYAKKIDKSMGHIDWNKDASEIERMIRALNPWPSAYTYIDGKMLKIWSAGTESEKTGTPGEVAEVMKDTITVSCGKGSLILKEVQLEGKKRMDVHDFLLGYKVQAGMDLA